MDHVGLTLYKQVLAQPHWKSCTKSALQIGTKRNDCWGQFIGIQLSNVLSNAIPSLTS